jgi:hypothetical protein
MAKLQERSRAGQKQGRAAARFLGVSDLPPEERWPPMHPEKQKYRGDVSVYAQPGTHLATQAGLKHGTPAEKKVMRAWVTGMKGLHAMKHRQPATMSSESIGALNIAGWANALDERSLAAKALRAARRTYEVNPANVNLRKDVEKQGVRTRGTSGQSPGREQDVEYKGWGSPDPMIAANRRVIGVGAGVVRRTAQHKADVAAKGTEPSSLMRRMARRKAELEKGPKAKPLPLPECVAFQLWCGNLEEAKTYDHVAGVASRLSKQARELSDRAWHDSKKVAGPVHAGAYKAHDYAAMAHSMAKRHAPDEKATATHHSAIEFHTDQKHSHGG